MTPAIPTDMVRETADGVVLRIHLQPRASRTELCGVHGDELKVRVTSPPVDDAANKLCIEFFAEIFSIAKSRVVITTGARSRHKTILVRGTTREEVVEILAAELGGT